MNDTKMTMGVLGPLMMRAGDRDCVPKARKPRQLLAFLMVNADLVVRASDCVVELWDNQQPKSAATTLQTYVLHLRSALGEVSMESDDRTLVTLNHCYQLAVDPLDVDCFKFEDLSRRGGDLARAGDHAGASAMFAEALALWRGPAFADVRPGPLSQPYVTELEETRRYVLERRIDADLKLHRHRELLDELDSLTKDQPTNENLHAQFMVALYRSDMRAQAQALFRKLCRTLEEGFGFEPGSRLKRLYEAVSSGRLALNGPANGAVSAAERMASRS